MYISWWIPTEGGTVRLSQSNLKRNAPQLIPSACWHRIMDAVVARFAIQRGTGPPALIR